MPYGGGGGGGNNPGGSGTEIQYRAGASTFGGIPSSSVTGNSFALGGTNPYIEIIGSNGDASTYLYLGEAGNRFAAIRYDGFNNQIKIAGGNPLVNHAQWERDNGVLTLIPNITATSATNGTLVVGSSGNRVGIGGGRIYTAGRVRVGSAVAASSTDGALYVVGGIRAGEGLTAAGRGLLVNSEPTHIATNYFNSAFGLVVAKNDVPAGQVAAGLVGAWEVNRPGASTGDAIGVLGLAYGNDGAEQGARYHGVRGRVAFGAANKNRTGDRFRGVHGVVDVLGTNISNGSARLIGGDFFAYGDESANNGPSARNVYGVRGTGQIRTAVATEPWNNVFGGEFIATATSSVVDAYGIKASVSGTPSGVAWAGHFAGNVKVTGKLDVDGLIDPTGLVLDEQATVPGGAPAAAKGTLWVRNDTPNVLVFTDDAGTDHVLGTGGGTPGGADTQVQFNDGGAFGGSLEFAWNKTAKTLTVAQGTKTTAASALVLSSTWNEGSTVFNGLSLAITNTASDATSTLFNATVDGSPKFTVDREGDLSNVRDINATGRILSALGTIATDVHNYDATAEWNNGAIGFQAFSLDVTDTASAADSRLLDFKVGGSQKFSVYKGGAILIGTTDQTVDGMIRWTGTDFEGRKGGAWVSLTATGGGYPSPVINSTSDHPTTTTLAAENVSILTGSGQTYTMPGSPSNGQEQIVKNLGGGANTLSGGAASIEKTNILDGESFRLMYRSTGNIWILL